MLRNCRSRVLPRICLLSTNTAQDLPATAQIKLGFPEKLSELPEFSSGCLDAARIFSGAAQTCFELLGYFFLLPVNNVARYRAARMFCAAAVRRIRLP